MKSRVIIFIPCYISAENSLAVYQRSELLTPSISKCPSLLGLEFPLRERFDRCLEGKVGHLENRKLSHSK